MHDADNKVVIFGAGAHGVVLAEALQLADRRLEGWIYDDDAALHGTRVAGREVRPSITIDTLDPASAQLANAVGSVGLPKARQAVYQRYTDKGFTFATVIHPAAIVSPSATLANGAQLMAGCVIQTHATIGINTIINTRASVDHDCVIGDHTHLAPGVTLSGNVTVGPGCHLGTGATVIQGVTIGKGSLVAAGAVVTQDLPPGSRVRGVPARPYGDPS